MGRSYLAASGIFLCSPAWCAPGVVLDGSFGTSGALPGPNFTITAGMGRQVGANLFQSFSDFNLTSSESATFTGPANIQNILARVTGGNASSIDGTINSTIMGANLFLLNPAGVMFGANAQVNVTGAFVVSTANEVKLSDGTFFYADVNHATSDQGLTSAPVSAFGFLTPTPQPISFAGSQITNAAGIHVIGGDITLDQGVPTGGAGQGTNLTAPSGNLTLFSAACAGEVPFSLSSPGTAFASATNGSFGHITIQNQSGLDISGAGGGSVVIRGGQLTVDHSSVTSYNDGGVAGGNISIQADNLTVGNGGAVSTDAEPGSTADAGSVTANVAGDVTLSSDSQIAANTETGANAGVVSLTAGGNVTLEDGSNIVAGTDGSGNGGTVSVRAASLDLGAGESGFSTLSLGAGNSGTIDVEVTGSINMTDDALISADTYLGGAGGNITVKALQLNMAGTSEISADAVSGSGNGGNVSIETGSLSIQGTGSLIPAFGKFLLGLTGITAQSFYLGNAGSVTIATGDLSLNGGAAISTEGLAFGNGGPISVTCTQGTLSDQSEITSGAFGTAGSVQITADSFTLSGNSNVNSSAGESGGDITLHVGRLLYLNDSYIQAYAGIVNLFNQASSRGGNIVIDPEFVVLDDSFISANDLAPGGTDGNIVNMANFFFTNDSTLHATGTIQTTPPDLDLAASLVGLPADLTDANSRLRERCAESINHEFSSFIVVGRGGTEAAPEELQPDFGLGGISQAPSK
jgi:filamentous hemagglutinin family protein